MNTQRTIGGLLLSAMLSAGALAQALTLDASYEPLDRIEFRVDGARSGELVVLALGLERAHIDLPGGLVLGVSPDLVTPCRLADGIHDVVFSVRFPAGMPDTSFLAQAVSVDPGLPFGHPKAVGLSQVREMTAPVTRE